MTRLYETLAVCVFTIIIIVFLTHLISIFLEEKSRRKSLLSKNFDIAFSFVSVVQMRYVLMDGCLFNVSAASWCLLCVFSALIDLWNYQLPFIYSCVSLFGVVMLLSSALLAFSF